MARRPWCIRPASRVDAAFNVVMTVSRSLAQRTRPVRDVIDLRLSMLRGDPERGDCRGHHLSGSSHVPPAPDSHGLLTLMSEPAVRALDAAALNLYERYAQHAAQVVEVP